MSGAAREAERIQPWAKDRRYWQFRGRPVMLIGASNEDNLFNHPDLEPAGLEAHLDHVVACGGNYVRNTMSSRDPGNVWQYARYPSTGRYDLNQFGTEYWQRFERFLAMTAERGIIVQIELWDRFDYARQFWLDNPFNPANNVNDTARFGLVERIDTHPSKRENRFFRSLPDLDNQPELLAYQEALIERIMHVSLRHDHVLYCISNETNDSREWSHYWARFIRQCAAERGCGIEVTEMWDPWDLHHDMHCRTFDHPDLFSFVDVSQNSHQQGQAQWDNLQWARQRVAHPPRPVNSIKMYGGKHGGGPDEGQHKLWRNILGGTASARYHRPGGGIGLNEITEAHLRAMTMLLQDVDIFTVEPAQHRLDPADQDAAYLAASDKQCALYFPRGDAVTLALPPGNYRLRWLNVLDVVWSDDQPITAGDKPLPLSPPQPRPFAAMLQKL